jgi:hypothetical protein
MASPKKKLPTGPIKIETSVSKTGLPEVLKQDSGNLDSTIDESVKRDSIVHDASAAANQRTATADFLPLAPETQPTNSSVDELKTIQESSFVDSCKQEFPTPEEDYKKVAMRLSTQAVERLQAFRHKTGLPYEILVDVMINNWDNLPQRIQSNYLQQAKQLRASRLIAGQEKTMKTIRAKYS